MLHEIRCFWLPCLVCHIHPSCGKFIIRPIQNEIFSVYIIFSVLDLMRRLLSCIFPGVPKFPGRLLNRFSSSNQISLDKQAPRTKISSYEDQLTNPSAVVSKFLSYPRSEFKKYLVPFLKEEVVQQLDVFNDYSLMIRQPTLNLIKDLQKLREVQINLSSDNQKTCDEVTSSLLSRFVPRFLLYGQPGCGISTVLAQVAHFAGVHDWLVLPFMNAERWLNRCMDLTYSNDFHQEQHRSHMTGDAFDFPSRAANWLNEFIQMNDTFLNKVCYE